jgi:hypothetical protein
MLQRADPRDCRDLPLDAFRAARHSVPVPLSRASQRGRRHVPIDAHIWRAVGARAGTAKQRAVFRSQLARSRRYARRNTPGTAIGSRRCRGATGGPVDPAWLAGDRARPGMCTRADHAGATGCCTASFRSIRDATLAIRAQARRDHRTDTGPDPRWTRIRVGGGAEGGGGVDGFAAGAAGWGRGQGTRWWVGGVRSRSRGQVRGTGGGIRGCEQGAGGRTAGGRWRGSGAAVAG